MTSRGDRPVDALHIHGYADPEVTRKVEQDIWKECMGSEGGERPVPPSLGEIGDGPRLEPLALTQLLLLHHMLNVAHDRNGQATNHAGSPAMDGGAAQPAAL